MLARMQLHHAMAALAALTAILMVMAAPRAVAQGASDCGTIESDAERLACYDCAGLRSDTERLACYDRALRGAAPIPRAPERSARGAAAPPPAPRATPPAAAAPAPAAPPAAAAAAPAEPRQVEIRGGRTGKDDDDEDEAIQIVVVALRKVQGNTRFTTDDGTVWVQTDGRSAFFPPVPFTAEIRPGTMGSRFLVPERLNRAVRVRRAE
jgi:hypothetical protein